MGEMADWYNDCMQDAYPDWSPYGSARNPLRDYTPQCKFCGSVDVQWIETAAGWRLYNDNGARHECNRGSADDFEDLDG